MPALTAPARPHDFTFVVPDTWVRIRVAEPADRSRDARRVARTVSRGRPDRDALVPVLAELLLRAATAHTGPDTVEVWLALQPVGATLVAASLAVCVVPPDGAAALDAELRAAPAGAQVLDLAGGIVLRARHRREVEVAGHRTPTEVVQYLFTVPGGGALLLSFSTPHVTLVGALRALFDAVAASLRWVA